MATPGQHDEHEVKVARWKAGVRSFTHMARAFLTVRINRWRNFQSNFYA